MSAAQAPSEAERVADGGAPPVARPTVFIGLGGAAVSVLKSLRRRLVEGQASNPASRLLAIDTDRIALQRAQAADDGAALSPEETLHLSLRKPTEYRESSDEILSWLSRRWLYNIPRSLRTEGLRPLGRLAFVDHRVMIADRLRHLLSGQSPRVFIVASIDGGAGGGMLLDVAYAVRQQLEELRLANDCLCGIMLHATLARGASNALRKANAYATLTELNHFMQGGAAFRAGPVEVLPVGDVSDPPFHDAYFIHLGDELNASEHDASLERVAEYLYLNATCAAATFDHFRRGSRQTDNANAPVALRSFGLHAVRVEKHALAREEAEHLCLRLIQKWSGDDADANANRARVQPPELGLDELGRRVQSLVEQTLGGNAEAHFRTLILPEAGFFLDSNDSAGRFEGALRRIHAALGAPSLHAGQSAQVARLDTVLADGAKKLAVVIGNGLVDSICVLVDRPQARLPAALTGANLFQEHLRSLREAADELLDRERATAQTICARLEQGRLPAERFWFSRLTTSNDDIEACLLAYCRSLLRVLVYRQVAYCLQEISSMLAALNERLIALRQSLRWLIDEFTDSFATRTAPADATAEPALAARLERLQTDCLAELECGQVRSLLGDRGLLALADHPERWRELGRQLREAARSAVAAALAELSAGSLLTERYPTDQGLEAWFAGAVTKAAPPSPAAIGTERLFALIPRGAGCERLAAALEPSFPDTMLITSDDSDLVLLREAGGIALTDVAARISESHDTCAAAARRVLTRVDVAWSELPLQPVPK